MRKFWITNYVFYSKKGKSRRHDVNEVRKDGTRGKLICSIDNFSENTERFDWEEMHERIKQIVPEKFDWKWWPGILKEKSW